MKKLLLLLILSFLSIQSFAGEVETNILKLKASNACRGCSFIGADLSGADLSGADLSGVNFSGANLEGVDFSGADLSGADLSGAYLSGVFVVTNLEGVDFSGADLSDADLRYVNLWNANLSGADLSGANLQKHDLTGYDLSGTNLSGADLSGVNLSRANLNLADLTGAFFCNTKTSDGSIDNSGCKEAEVEVKVSSTEVLDDNFTVYLGYLLYYSNYCDKSSSTKLAEYYRQYNIIHSKFIKNPLVLVGFKGADKMGCFTMKPFLTDAGLL